jgi:hypothetical protein
MILSLFQEALFFYVLFYVTCVSGRTQILLCNRLGQKRIAAFGVRVNPSPPRWTETLSA